MNKRLLAAVCVVMLGLNMSASFAAVCQPMKSNAPCPMEQESCCIEGTHGVDRAGHPAFSVLVPDPTWEKVVVGAVCHWGDKAPCHDHGVDLLPFPLSGDKIFLVHHTFLC